MDKGMRCTFGLVSLVQGMNKQRKWKRKKISMGENTSNFGNEKLRL